MYLKSRCASTTFYSLLRASWCLHHSDRHLHAALCVTRGTAGQSARRLRRRSPFASREPPGGGREPRWEFPGEARGRFGPRWKGFHKYVILKKTGSFLLWFRGWDQVPFRVRECYFEGRWCQSQTFHVCHNYMPTLTPKT